MTVVTKREAAQAVEAARFRQGVTWQSLADSIDRPLLWTVAALLGQFPLDAAAAESIGGTLGLDAGVVEALRTQPFRGAPASELMQDPTIYRFYEALAVFGPAIKAVIHEEFGDGIMSAINFRLDVQRRADPEGDRVVVTFDGKFLDYKW